MKTDRSPPKTNIIHFPLLDGPLKAIPAVEQPALVYRMAADLLEADAYCDHRTAFAALLRKGYHSFHIAARIDDAMQYAAQVMVAMEMGGS